jgi:hypothetical protein
MNISDSAKKIISAIAPLIGTAIGGPFGGLAGSFLASKLGTAPGDDKAIETAVMSGNPDVMVKLQQANNDFKAHMADIGLSEDKLVFDDIANARAREMAVKDLTPAILAYAITVGFFGVLGFMLAYGKPAVGGDALLVMLGSLGTAWAGVISYYFGSSLGSSVKDTTIASMSKKA